MQVGVSLSLVSGRVSSNITSDSTDVNEFGLPAALALHRAADLSRLRLLIRRRLTAVPLPHVTQKTQTRSMSDREPHLPDFHASVEDEDVARVER